VKLCWKPKAFSRNSRSSAAYQNSALCCNETESVAHEPLTKNSWVPLKTIICQNFPWFRTWKMFHWELQFAPTWVTPNICKGFLTLNYFGIFLELSHTAATDQNSEFRGYIWCVCLRLFRSNICIKWLHAHKNDWNWIKV